MGPREVPMILQINKEISIHVTDFHYLIRDGLFSDRTKEYSIERDEHNIQFVCLAIEILTLNDEYSKHITAYLQSF